MIGDASNKVSFSIIICTHNPRKDYLNQVIESIKDASSNMKVECVIVDNRSTPPIEERKEIIIPPWMKLTKENRPGLVYARAKGVRETTGNWIIFVDDDNILSKNYLHTAEEYIIKYPLAGVFSGSISASFQYPPESWTLRYHRYLAVINHTKDVVSFLPNGGTLPIGAGMVVSRSIMNEYVGKLARDPFTQKLGRDAGNLFAGDDTYIGLIALSANRSCVLCKELRLTHLIPPERVELDYIKELVISVTASQYFLGLNESIYSPPKLPRRILGNCLVKIKDGISPQFPVALYILKEIGRAMGYRIYKREGGPFSTIKPTHVPTNVDKFVTCDVFDTILIRQNKPADIFKAIEENFKIKNFAKMRVDAESKRRSASTGEVTFDEIYEELAFYYKNYNLDFWEKIRSEEIRIEKATCLPTKKSRKFVESLRRDSGKIVFLSDMYLPASFIKSMLKEHGVFKDGDSLIVSCEIGASKSNGGAFAWVEEKFKPKNWHHFGDNLYSDYLIPRRHGIQATWRPKSLSEQIMQATKFTAKYILNAGKYPKK